MSISNLMKKLSIAATGVAFLGLGTVGADSAKAITFNFSDTVRNVAVEGTATINDALLAQVLAQEPSYEYNAGFPDAVEFLEFSLGGTTIFSGIPSSSRILSAIDGVGAFAGKFLIFGGEDKYLGNPFRISLGFPLPAERCLQEKCSGIVKFDGLYDFFPIDPENPSDKYGIYGAISVEPAIAKSVPEPSAAIALSLIGVSILIRKRKVLSSQRA
ncbi:MAG TPA: PEP-CTERM sorting domain-containing protein [Phormidium sp.]